jgi:lipoprotein
MKRKTILSCLAITFAASCLFAASCGGEKGGTAKAAVTETDYKDKEAVFVYDARENLVAVLAEKKQLEYIGSLIGGSIGQSGEAATLELVIDVPEDAKVLYHYVFKNRTEQKMNLYVYSNYQKIRITDIPLLSSIVWNVTDADYDTLIHPEKI